MREKNPIDELFGVLSDAEATPPPAVWQGVVRRRHWSHRLLLQLERKWGWTVLLLLLLLGSPIVWLAAQGGFSGEREGAVATATMLPSEPNMNGGTVTTSTPVETVRMDPAIPTGAKKSDVRVAPASNAMATKSNDLKRSADPRPEMEKPTSPSASSKGIAVSIESGSAKTDPSLLVDVSLLASDIAPGAASADDDRDAAFVLAMAKPRPIGLRRGDLPLGPTLNGTAQAEVYALAKGNWFIGVQGGLAKVNGSWKGKNGLEKSLNTAEEWRGQRSIGLLVGYHWNNGWAIATGVGLAYRDSRFLQRGTGPGTVTNVVDTTWLVTPAGPVSYSTWNIDTLQVLEPGAEHDFSAINHYGLLQIPVELGRQWSWARWTLDLRGGVVLGTTLQRDGHTLAITGTLQGDSTTAPVEVMGDVALKDGRVSDRFGLSMALFAGAELGYRLGDRLSAHIGPRYAQDVLGGRDVQLRTSQLGAVLRIEHNFRAHERRSPAPPR